MERVGCKKNLSSKDNTLNLFLKIHVFPNLATTGYPNGNLSERSIQFTNVRFHWSEITNPHVKETRSAWFINTGGFPEL